MKATVVKNEFGKVRVIVRRNFNSEPLYRINHELKVGDVVQVKRQVNNPYLILVEKEKEI